MDERVTNALVDRVWGCVPVTGQAFSALLSLLKIEASEAIPTACVTTGECSRMLLNPSFVQAHCRTDEHLAMLVLHELYHVVLGHTRLYPRITPAQNWAFDCLINAQLCRLFPHPRYTTFFTQFSGAASGPGMLLAPPPGWERHLPDAIAARRRHEAVQADPRLGDAHWRLYDDDSITTEELYRLLLSVAASPREGDDARETGGGASDDEGASSGEPCGGGRCGNQPDWRLLGNHDSDEADGLHPDAMREIREIVARWPMVDRRSGRDQGRQMERTEVTLGRRRNAAVRALRRALALAAQRTGASGPQRLSIAAMDTIEPLDSGHDRKSAVVRMLGGEPLLHAGSALARTPAPQDRVRVYLDLSGSMDGVLEPLYAALAQVLEQVEPRVHGFSTQIGTLTHAELRRGVRLSDGGTGIDAVTGHLLECPARAAVIVTDGWVGRIPDDHLRRLGQRRIRLVAVVTADGDPSFATDAGCAVIRLPALS